MSTPPATLHPELLAEDDMHAIYRDGRRLDHAEGASKPLHSQPEPEPRGAKVHGTRPIDQAEAAARFIAAPEHEKMHDERLWDLRQKRDREMHGIAEWEELRSLASAIKEHMLTHLDQYLEQFEDNARSHGVHVHWARDAAEHNRIVHSILSDHGAKSVIKSKSMLTEECGFRSYMASVGIEVIETDLGERIQQLDNEDPSHVVVPAVHKLRTDVAEVFAKTIGTDPANSDVHYLAEAQREATRPLILKADAGMTGCNFAVAETGTFVVCTNEGNADLSANVPKLHIASIGIAGLAGHAIHFAFPRAPDRWRDACGIGRQWPLGPTGLRGVLDLAQMHPVRRLHEHLPGLSPQRRPQLRRHLLGPDRPHYRSDLQPAKIQQPALRFDIEWQLHQCLPGEDQYPRADLCVAAGARRAARDPAGQEGRDEGCRRIAVAASAYRAAIAVADVALVHLPRFVIYNGLNAWGRHREVPHAPKQTFHSWYQANRGGK
jgi:L-lactate dehydrogenase complex protein LldF